MSLPNFSSTNRDFFIKKLQNESFDLLIIGGGVTGCGIALDAASRGIRTCLIEKNDFASGTSSKSTKLIHGGLRYLKQFEFGLVRESGMERAVVHRLAPHLVVPEKMLLPLVKGGSLGKVSTYFGLKIYDALAKVKGDDKMRMLSKKETIEMEPLLGDSKVVGGAYYSEYRTDDARLTVELAKTAYRNGAILLNYIEAEQMLHQDGIVSGVSAYDHLSEKSFEIKADFVVSAAGPWVDEIRKKENAIGKKSLHLTKGVHIVFPYEQLPVKTSVYFDNYDGRMIFAIPRGRITYVGTTDTNYHADKDDIRTFKKDAEYLLSAIRYAFPGIQLEADQIESSWAGLRPLIHEDGKSPSELSRRDEIFESNTGLVSIAGGKLTGYRKMAKRIVDKIADKLKNKGKVYGPSKTKNIRLSQDPFLNYREVEGFITKLCEEIEKFGLKPLHCQYLVHNYGKSTSKILAAIDPKLDPEKGLLQAELNYCFDHELVERLEDFFVRRSGRLFFYIESVSETNDFAASVLADRQSWDGFKKEFEKKNVENLLLKARTFPDV